MKLSKLTQIAELISSLVVVVSLVVLIVEIQANTQEIRINNAREVMSRSGELSVELGLNEGIAEIVAKARNDETLSEVEQIRHVSWLRGFIRNFETIYFMYESGALDEAILENYSVRLRNFIGFNPAALAGIEDRIDSYSPRFIEWVYSSLDP